MGIVALASEDYRIEQEIHFDNHILGSDTGYPNGGEIEIRRGADGLYWDEGLGNFAVPQVWNSTTVDSSGVFHYFDFTVPSGASSGDTFIIKIRAAGDVYTEHLFHIMVRSQVTVERVFDGVDFATGFPSTVEVL